MRIQSEKSDAIELVKDIKEQMATLRDLLGQLEYLVYQCDDRVDIEFFKGGVHDKTGSKE